MKQTGSIVDRDIESASQKTECQMRNSSCDNTRAGGDCASFLGIAVLNVLEPKAIFKIKIADHHLLMRSAIKNNLIDNHTK